MSFGDDLCVSNVFWGLKGANAEQALKEMARKVAGDTSLPFIEIRLELERILRNKPGIGDGVAVFDWMSPDVEDPYVFLARLGRPLDIQAVDARPAEFFLVLISPETRSVTHLRHLSRLTRFFKDDTLMDRLRSTTCEDGMRSILCPENLKILAA